MRLIDFLANNTEDIDLYVDGIDGIAVVSADDLPMLTPEGYEHFRDCFDLNVEGHLIEGTDEDYDAMYDFEDGKTEDGGRMYLAWEFISALAGYCAATDFHKWFDESRKFSENLPSNTEEKDETKIVHALIHTYRDEDNGLEDTELIGIYADIEQARAAMKKEFDNARRSMLEDEGYEEDDLEIINLPDNMQVYKKTRQESREVFSLARMNCRYSANIWNSFGISKFSPPDFRCIPPRGPR